MSFWNCNNKISFFMHQLHVLNSKVRKQKCTYRVSNSKWSFLFFNLKLVSRKQKTKSLTIKLVTWNEIKYFQLRVSNSKCKFLFFNFELGTRKWNKKSVTVELVTQVNFFIFWLRVSNSKCNFLFCSFVLLTRK